MDFKKLSGQRVRIHRAVVLAATSILLAACTTLPEPKFEAFEFPEGVFITPPADRPFDKIGPVRSKVSYGTLTDKHDETALCKNYFKKAARDLLKQAQKKGADAVIDLKSVVYMMDGKSKTYSHAECSDDGSEGQVLVQGMAIRWKKPETEQ